MPFKKNPRSLEKPREHWKNLRIITLLIFISFKLLLILNRTFGFFVKLTVFKAAIQKILSHVQTLGIVNNHHFSKIHSRPGARNQLINERCVESDGLFRGQSKGDPSQVASKSRH